MSDHYKKRWDRRADTLVRELKRLEGLMSPRWDRSLSLQIDQIHVDLDAYGYSDTDDKYPGAEDKR